MIWQPIISWEITPFRQVQGDGIGSYGVFPQKGKPGTCSPWGRKIKDKLYKLDFVSES